MFEWTVILIVKLEIEIADELELEAAPEVFELVVLACFGPGLAVAIAPDHSVQLASGFVVQVEFDCVLNVIGPDPVDQTVSQNLADLFVLVVEKKNLKLGENWATFVKEPSQA